MAPKISIIIPMYNVEKYLRRCLDSILNQTFTEWQAICVNDGSPDNSGAIASEYAACDKRFVVINKKNAGVSAARNDGITFATGDYIHFMDADDFIDSDYYQKMYEAAVKCKCDMVCSGFVTNTKYSRDLRYRKDFVADVLRDKLGKTYALSDGYVWRYLFNRRFITNNNLLFDTGMISQEDAMFVLNALRLADKVAFVSGTFYHYVFNSGSALNSRSPEHHAKMKQQYKVGKEFRRKFAREHGLMRLWRWRKFIRRFQIMG